MPRVEWAEDANYFQTSRSEPGTWLDRAAEQINKAGGQVLGHAFGTDPQTGADAYMLLFRLDGEEFKIIWPALPSKTGKVKAAQRQAATALFYDVKARCVASKFLGGRTAFFSYLMLPNGQTTTQVAAPELLARLPGIISGIRALPSGEGIEG